MADFIKTVNSLKFNLFLNATLLVLILILYIIFSYVIQPSFLTNATTSQIPFIAKMTNIASILILGLILLIAAKIIVMLINILRCESKLESDFIMPVETSDVQNEGKNLYEDHNSAIRSEQKQIEKIKNDRLYTMGSLAAGIIHDFKNPISSISLCVQAISQGFVVGDKRDSYLRKIEDQVDRMLNMTQDFLDYAHGQKSLKFQQVEFTKTIKDQIEFHREKSEKMNVDLRYSLPDPFYIKIDVHKFRRVLDNIITNAFEVLKSGQSIRIDISTDESGLKLQISDDGPGISPEILPKIFEPFFTEGKSKGSGLGLSISKKIVEDHGGSLSVKSKLGKGTSFLISLPHQLFCKEAPNLISEKNNATVS